MVASGVAAETPPIAGQARPYKRLAVDATTVLVVQAVRSLSTEQRQAVALHYLLDMPVEQVAAELGRPVNTVKTHLARGRARQAEALREEAEHGCGR